MSVTDVREAIASALRDGCSINADPYLVSRVRPPHAMVDYEIPQYDVSMYPINVEYSFTVTVWTQRDNEVQSQKLLDTLRDPTDSSSIKTILESDAGVLAVVDSFEVRSSPKLQAVQVGSPGVEYLVAEFECRVVLSA